LNGFELFRSNMPTGTISPDTVASSVVADADETTYFPHSAGTNRLITGTNLLAVEIHQANPTTTDLSFDLALDGTPVNRPPSVAITEPFNNLALDAPASITIAAMANDDDGAIDRVEFFVNGSKAGEDSSIPFSFDLSGMTTGEYIVSASAIDNAGASTRSQSVRVVVKKKLSAAGAVWKFLDNGSDAGIGWRRSDFNDNGWSSGMAEFGYGDGDEATLVGYGGNAANKFVTTYFRRGFVIGDPAALTNFTVRLRCDDGAIGFLNGMEAFRSNMPEGAINYRTPAGVPLGSPDETAWSTIAVDPALFVFGTNVLAVEVHQADPGSSDISFDLELVADFAPPPQIEINRSGGTCVLTWPAWADDFELQSSSTLNPASWTTLPLPAGRTFFNDGITNVLRFYRLRRP
jgi:hypothetical protein